MSSDRSTFSSARTRRTRTSHRVVVVIVVVVCDATAVGTACSGVQVFIVHEMISPRLSKALGFSHTCSHGETVGS
jgi:hypothetical protein